MDLPSPSGSLPANRRLPPIARIGALVGLLLAVGAAVWALQGGVSLSSDVPRVGSAAPNFSLGDTNGKGVSLSSYRGHPVIVNFWATWCPPCRAEMPAIDAVAKANPNVVVLAVDVLEGPALVQMYLKDVPLGFAPLLDPEGRVSGLYKVNSLPSSFFVGPDGTIRAINIGPMDQPTIEANLRLSS